MKRLIALLLLFLPCSLIFATDGMAAADSMSIQTIDFSIRFHAKRIYYVGDKEHPIQIEAVITNNSPQTYRFKMANNRVFNIDFEVTTPTNLMLDHAKEFTIAKLSNQPILFREISLEPGEKFGIVLSLPNFVSIEKPGLYAIRAVFYSEMIMNTATLKSNTLTVNIRPAVVFPEEKAMIAAETGKMIRREALPPDEVVAYTLKARQRSQWEKFLLYLDLESLYTRKPERARSFTRMSEEDRETALKRFENQLMQEKVDQDILLIPVSFEIVRTTYTPFEASVVVTEKFQYPDYVEIKRYTYTLNRRDKIWIITD